MDFKPHEYQKRAIAWVEDHPRCLLFLDMGLGKTVSVLTAISNLQVCCEASRVLVVAPKKVAEGTWSTEARKWEHLRHLKVTVLKGVPDRRRKQLAQPADIYVMSRDQVTWLLSETKGKPVFDMMVIDELTSFKAPSSQRSKAMRRLAAATERVVGLTGTPTPNGLYDLWGQLAVVDNGERLGKYITHYRDEYFNVIEHNNIPIKVYPKAGAEEAIRAKIADIALTMTAADWLSLPEMVETDVPVTLTHRAADRYLEFQKEKIMNLDGETLTSSSAATLSVKLAQMANGAVYDEDGHEHEVHADKLDMLRELVESAATPVLVFYQYQHDCRRIMESLADLKPRKYEGQRDLEEWNAGKVRVLLAHPASTAFGLNLQKGGSTIVWFSLGWNLELYQQANARLHRQGQERPVMVYRLIATGTIDERQAAAISQKATGQASFLKEMKKLIQETKTDKTT